MKRIQTLIMSGAVLSLAATGVVLAQSQAGTDNAAPAATTSDQSTRTDATGQPSMDSGDQMGRHHRGRLARLDANGDGALEPDEMKRVGNVKAADADGDGTLSQKEIEDMVLHRMVERRANRLAKRLDVDGDGKVTVAEVQDRAEKRFAFMDRDGDGKLQGDELKNGRMGRHGGHFGHRGRHFGRHDGKPWHQGGTFWHHGQRDNDGDDQRG